MSGLLRVESLYKSFTTKFVKTNALIDVNLTINSGDFAVITGPSGGGKSTLLSILSLLQESDSGSYFLRDKDISQLSLDEKAKLRNKEFGIIFQSFNLVGDLTVAQNVALPLRYSRSINKSQYLKNVTESLERVGLESRANHLPAQLSGGQQQRVAIARALSTSPSIIFADEPTGNLDTKNRDTVLNLLSELNSSGVTICLVTHDTSVTDLATKNFQIIDGNVSKSSEMRLKL
ncbi:MAG: ABC transporter ATP-binding protein [Kangiellaceae bacterium]|jgi:putative ABC transport system ATP-binding protein|nr:ABC transporter ATP-binding protein [Kangiellaceae bacterium]